MFSIKFMSISTKKTFVSPARFKRDFPLSGEWSGGVIIEI